ncbi:hypothetical protein LTR37_002640 [Vermiconidia calcicola]|uniref:Uncharacterized protein n=1 Tax=Vermiconidia calcicola TaxID=1690605 RepID=A0ACC3NS91_9PEZI|nr:hypothetical protein LTR37_002640 [Vermiconidia calcicola]
MRELSNASKGKAKARAEEDEGVGMLPPPPSRPPTRPLPPIPTPAPAPGAQDAPSAAILPSTVHEQSTEEAAPASVTGDTTRSNSNEAIWRLSSLEASNRTSSTTLTTENAYVDAMSEQRVPAPVVEDAASEGRDTLRPGKRWREEDEDKARQMWRRRKENENEADGARQWDAEMFGFEGLRID